MFDRSLIRHGDSKGLERSGSVCSDSQTSFVCTSSRQALVQTRELGGSAIPASQMRSPRPRLATRLEQVDMITRWPDWTLVLSPRALSCDKLCPEN